MSNMSYCRFQNTYRDLVDCRENLFDPDISEDDKMYRRLLIDVCRDIVNQAEEDAAMLDEDVEDDEETDKDSHGLESFIPDIPDDVDLMS